MEEKKLDSTEEETKRDLRNYKNWVEWRAEKHLSESKRTEEYEGEQYEEA